MTLLDTSAETDSSAERATPGEVGVVEAIRALLERGQVPDDDLRAVLGAAVRAYARLQAGRPDHVAPYDSASGVTPTDALRTAAGLLRESDVSSFELAMMFNL